MVHYAFRHLRLKRIVATTTYDNTASLGVMRKLGMRVEKNPHLEPPWLQVVGVLENSMKVQGVLGDRGLTCSLMLLSIAPLTNMRQTICLAVAYPPAAWDPQTGCGVLQIPVKAAITLLIYPRHVGRRCASRPRPR